MIPERRSAEVTAAVCKASAGAVEHLPVAQVRNLADFLAEAKAAGAWCYGAAAGASTNYRQPDYSGGVLLVLGAEGKGMRRLTRERCDVLREADAIILHEIEQAGLGRQLWQVFGVLLPVQSVGVMGDARTYENALAIRAVESVDAMTADWAHLPYELLGRMSNRIINEVKGVNRVVYDITSKPPGTIEWE